MRHLLTLTLLGLLTALTHADEQLSLPTPEGWHRVSNLSTPLQRLSTFAIPVDAGGSFDALSFEWFARTLAANTTPLALAEQVAQTVRRNCSGGRDEPVFADLENGYPTLVRLLLCPQLNDSEPAQGELLMVKIIAGEAGFWILIRSRPIEPQAPIKPQALRTTLSTWSRTFRTITLCNPASPSHPCPGAE